jgi:hypothetical protein
MFHLDRYSSATPNLRINIFLYRLNIQLDTINHI